MQRRKKSIKAQRAFVAFVAIALLAGACGSGSESDPGANPSTGQTGTESGGDDSGTDDGGGVDEATGDAESTTNSPASSDDPLADAQFLTPSITFTLVDAEWADSLAISPDGTMIAVASQEANGEIITIRLYDLATGEVTQSTTVDVINLGILEWMADNRIVASFSNSSEPTWKSWDGATLEPLPDVPLDFDCLGFAPDKNTGAMYSIDSSGEEDALCRVDTLTGAVSTSPEGALVSLRSYWVRSGTGEIVAFHEPSEDSSELVTFDGATFERKETLEVTPGLEQVDIVGATAWITNFDERTARLEPGNIAVPRIRDLRHVSSAGTVFVSANGNDDKVLVSAIDGTVLGLVPAGMNDTLFGDWSIDDSVYVTLDSNLGVEVYKLGS